MPRLLVHAQSRPSADPPHETQNRCHLLVDLPEAVDPLHTPAALEGGHFVHFTAAGGAAHAPTGGGELLLLHLQEALDLPAAGDPMELVHRLDDQLLLIILRVLALVLVLIRGLRTRRGGSCGGDVLLRGGRGGCLLLGGIGGGHDEGLRGGGEGLGLGLAPPTAGVAPPGGGLGEVGLLALLIVGVDGLGQDGENDNGGSDGNGDGRSLLGRPLPLLGLAGRRPLLGGALPVHGQPPLDDGLAQVQTGLELRPGEDALEGLRHGGLRVVVGLVQLDLGFRELRKRQPRPKSVSK
eukprot:573514-Prorocentrum_minimum.AAC.1